MKISLRRSVLQRVHGFRPADAARACALGILLLAGAAACEQVASPELRPSETHEASGGIGGTVLDLEGRPVAGAAVRAANGAEAATDAEGRFRIGGLAATPRLAVTVDAPGYDRTTKVYEVRAGVDLVRPIRVQPLAPPVVIDGGAGGVVAFQGGGALEIPAGALAVAPGEPVSIRATYVDSDDAAQFAASSGDFTAVTRAGQNVRLESFGMLNVEATDAAGQPVELAPGRTAVARFPLRGSATSGTLPVWTFDEQEGRWVEEGAAAVTSTSIDATVPSLRPRRNIDIPLELVCIAVRVVRPDGTPRPNEYVSATGISYAGITDGWTDGTGVVRLPVGAAAQVQVAAGPAQQIVTTPPAGTTGCPGVATLVF